MGQTPSSSASSSASFLAIHAVAEGCCQRWSKMEMRGLMRRMKALGARSVRREKRKGSESKKERKGPRTSARRKGLSVIFLKSFTSYLLSALLLLTPPSLPPSLFRPLPPFMQGKPTLIYRRDLETAVKETGLSGTTEAEILGEEETRRERWKNVA